MKLLLSSLSILVLAGCANTVEGDRDPFDNTPAAGPQPVLTFGEAKDDSSSDADELFEKLPANPNPKTLAGIYERKGYGSEDRPSSYVVIQNDWRTRLEIRDGKVVAGIECKMEVGGAANEKRTLRAYVSSPITVETWGVRIAESGTDKDTWPEYELECEAQLPAEDWPYCLAPYNSVPDGYAMCIYLSSSLELKVKKIDSSEGSMGTKISN